MKTHNILLIIFVFVSTLAFAQTPVVSSFSPTTGTVGSTVTITGSGFDGSAASNNKVFFGSAEATVLTATFSQLTVSVPAGSTTNLISVLNKTTKKTGYSNNHFNGVFCSTPLTSTTYNTYNQQLSGIYGGYNVDIYDMNGDGKSDIVTANGGAGITIARNGSTIGTMNFSAYNINAGVTCQQFFIADFDGDGKRDIIVSGSNGIYLFPNNSTIASMSFGSRITVDNTRAYYQCAAGDLNNDGLIDIVGGSNNGDGKIYTFKNNSSGIGSFSFSANVASLSVGCLTRGLQCVDLDGDSKSDIVGTTWDCQTMYAMRNTTTTGNATFTFATTQTFSCPGNPYRLKLGDFDKDGKIDLVTPLYTSNQTGIFRNTSTIGNISFSGLITLVAVNQNYRVGVGDVNGDGFPDIVTKPNGIGTIFQVYQNTSTGAGSISFNTAITYSSSAGAEVGGIAIGDMDGDLVPDIATSGTSSNVIRFHRNTSAQVDNIKPKALCKNITIALGQNGTVVVTPPMIDNGSSDECGIGSLKINSSSSITYTCSDIGSHSVTLLITDNSGNKDSCTATVTVAPAAIIVAGQTTVCQGQTVLLTANQADTYQWYKDGTAISGATSQTYSAASTGSYQVAVTNSGGCSGTSAAVAVVVNNNPTVEVTPASVTHLCSGSATLTASTSSLYQWKLNGNNISGATNQSYSATAVGTYSVQVIDAFGCSATSSNISVTNNPPEIDITGNGVSIVNGDATPSASDHTDFGTVGNQVRTYTISNSGSGNLHIDNIAIGGTNSSHFALSGITLPTDVAPGNTTTFTVTYSLATIGTSSANITVTNNDCNENVYNYSIYGELSCTNPVFTTCPSNITVDTDDESCDAVVTYSTTVTGTPTPSLSYVFSGVTSGSGSGNGSGSTFNLGTTTVTITASNSCTTTSCVFTVTVEDNEDPVIDGVNQNLTVNFNAGSGAPASYTEQGITFLSLYGTSSHVHLGDNNGDGSNDLYNHSGCCSTPYRLTVGNNVSFTLVSMEVKSVSGNPTFYVYPTGASVTITSTGTYTFPSGFAGVTEIRWHQPSGGMVIDNVVVSTKTSGSCPANITKVNEADKCGANVTYAATASDNCSASISFSPASGSFFPVGTTEVTTTATDGSGNTSTCKFNVTVNDVQKPTITCVGNQSKVADNGVCTYTANGTEFDPTSIGDNCGIKSVKNNYNNTSSLNGAVFGLGTTIVVWTATDSSGNTQTCSNTVTVTDDQKPTITCVGNQSKNADNGTCTYTVQGTEFNPTAIGDNCSIASVTNNFNNASSLANAVFGLGTTTVTWTITDGSSNTETCSNTVTVTDDQKPTITCVGNQSKNADNGTCTYTVQGTEFNPTATGDNCSIASVTNNYNNTSSLNGAVFSLGATTVTWTITDGSGNTETCSNTVTVTDNQKPTITCVGNQSKNADNGTCTYTVQGTEFNPTATGDNCSVASVTNNFNNTSSLNGAVFNLGTTTVTWTITDGSGNTETCSNTVTVTDDQKPTITCVGNQSKNADNGTCTYTVQGTEFNPTVTGDNCSIASVTNNFNNTSSLANAVFSLGTTTVVWTITDGSGNTETCSNAVTVTDDQKPTITCASDGTRYTDAGVCTYTIDGTEFDPTATGDNCSVASVTNNVNGTSTLNGEVFNLGITTVTWTVTDGSGNTQTCDVDVKVEDITPPTVITQNVTVTLASGGASITAANINNGSNDACGIASVSVSPSTFNCSNIGTNTVTLTVVDNNGNSNTGTAIVTVVGVVPACSITSSANTSGSVIGGTTTYAATNQMFLGYGAQSMNIVCTASGAGGFTYAWTGSGLSSTTVYNPVFTPSAAGNYTLSCTVTNSYGCEVTCKIVICVIDAVGKGGSAKNPKVTICHVPAGNTSNTQTLSISVNAVSAHLGYHGGCTLGACGTSCNDNKSYKIEAPIGEMHNLVHGLQEADLIVYPNPSINSFNFIMESPIDDLVSLAIYDMSGRLITEASGLAANDEVNFGGDLPRGMYFVVFNQASFSKTIKISKVY